MVLRTAKQEVAFQKAFMGQRLSQEERLEVFALSFEDRSAISMARLAARLAEGKLIHV